MADLTIHGTGGDDLIVITATGSDSGFYSINGGGPVAFKGLASISVTGGAGNDTLTIINPDGGLLAPTGGISYDAGNQPADALEVLGGIAETATYTAATPNSGTLAYASAAGTQVIQFAGIAPIVDTVAAATLNITGTAGFDAISVSDGGLANGFQSTLVSTAGTFESVQFANKTRVNLNGNGGNDTVRFNNPNPAAGLTTFVVTNVGTVAQNGAIKYNTLDLSVSGPVTLLHADNDIVSLAAALSGVGDALQFHDTNTVNADKIIAAGSAITTNGGDVTITADGNITVFNNINAGSGAVTLVAGDLFTSRTVTVDAGISVTGTGGVDLVGDNIVLEAGAAVNAGTATATLRPKAGGTLIDLGGADGSNTLGLTDAELDQVSAGVLRIGDPAAGNIDITAPITPAGTNQLELVTGAAIEGNAFGTEITVTRLGMTAQTGIGVDAFDINLQVAVSNLEAQTTTGDIRVSQSSGGDLTIGGVNATLTGLKVVTSGDIQLVQQGGLFLPGSDGVATALGGIDILAYRMTIAAASSITANGTDGHVTIRPVPVAANWSINLGSATDVAANTLELSDAELDRITTPVLRIGGNSSGDITITSPITSDGHYDTLSLTTAGAIIDGTAGEQPDIAVNKLALRAGSGIGSVNSADLDLDTSTSTLAFSNTGNGDVVIRNVTALTAGAVDGLSDWSSTGNALAIIQVETLGSLTVAANVSADYGVDLWALETPAPGDGLTVLGGVTIQSGYITVAGGDSLTLQAGSTLQADDLILASVDTGDDATGGTGTLNGVLTAQSTNIQLLGFDDSDTLTGSAGPESLRGFGGDDTINGGGGGDILDGGGGGDFLDGGAGGDFLDGGAGFDLASWLSQTSGLTLNLGNQGLNAGAAAGDTVTNVEGLYLTNSADNYTGGVTGLFVYGFGGNDTLTGSTQSDFFDGGAGGDTINAGGGFDYVSYNSSTAAVTLNLQTPASNTGHAAGDAISNADAYILTEFGDTFIGLASGQNIVFGYGGNDTLVGGFNANNWFFGGDGNDRMVGGGVADLFVGDNGADTIVPVTPTPIAGSSVFGFTPGTDALEISRAAFGLSAGYAVNTGSTFAAGTAPANTVASPTFLYYTNSGLLYFDPDGTGATAATLLMQFDNAAALTPNDFDLV